ncbi:RebB family R body protein [Chryseobacterium sp. PTM-20240506]|uniref:RebB family R body protein n=1 Tax=unclassified Chryseobacterium TaxID=2593645 RepID=UPI001555F682|nr:MULTISPECIES: RebB family R body protein [unclassified Chryseobacterium]MDC8104726.1 RebB family R body protein [Chryseobacterium sp. B21-037]WBV58226.1 RebB family R body protein [Chryseobacterium daecheongense]
MIHNQNEINLEVVGMAPTVPTAISMQVNAHSTGLMYEQSVSHQQRDALIGLSNSVMGIKKIGSRKLKKELLNFRKGRFNF